MILRVVIGGWYGAANLGDELLLSVVAGWVRDAGGEPVAISNAPEHTRATHGIDSVAYDDLPALVETMSRSELFVWGGGGLLHDYFGLDRASLAHFPARNATQFAQQLILADELGLPTVALAQGVGPLSSEEARDIARDVFTRASGVSLRDWGSAALLREIGVTRKLTVAPDPAWAWTRTRVPVREGSLAQRFPALQGRRVMAVIPREWPVDPDWESRFVDVLRSALPEAWAVAWLDFHREPRAPADATSAIVARMTAALADQRTHAVWHGEQAGDAFDLIAQCDACVAMRLHGVLLAAAAGVPAVAVEYDDKVGALADELGLDASLRVPIGELSSRLADAIRTAAGTARVANPPRAAELGELALTHRDLLHDAMARAATAANRRGASERGWLESWIEHSKADVLPAALARLRRAAVVDVDADPAADAAAVAAARSERDGAYRAALVASLDRDDAIRLREAAERERREAEAECAAAREEAGRLREELRALESRSVMQTIARRLFRPTRVEHASAATTTPQFPAEPAPVPTLRAERHALVPGLVSIVLPVHDGADLLEGSVRSVLAQTYRPIELIIVDDGSTDGVDVVLAQFAGHAEVRVVVQPNQKLPRALSHGFALARGEFWTWTSDDNVMGRRQIELMAAKLRAEPDTAMTYADYYVIDERGNPLARPWRGERPDPATGAVRVPRSTERLNLLPDNFIGPSFMYRGWIGRLLRPYDLPQGVEDYDYWMRINALFRIRHLGVDQPMYWYRVHARTLSEEAAPRIRRRVDDLMDKERERAAYFGKPLAVRADAPSLQWLRGHALGGAAAPLDSPLEGHDGPAVLVAAARTDVEAALPAPAGVTVPLALVFDDAAVTPYHVAALLRRPHVVALVKSEADAVRVRVVSAAPVVDAEAADAGHAMEAFARDAGFWIRTHADPVDPEVAPEPFVDATRRTRIAVDVASGVSDEAAEEIVEMAASLASGRLDAVVVLSEARPSLEALAAARSVAVEVAPGGEYREWLRERRVALVNAHGAPVRAGIAAKLGIPLVQTVRADQRLDDATYREAAAATTAYLCQTLEAARIADLEAGFDPAKMHLPDETGRAGDDFAAAHARLFHALLRR